MLSSKAPERLRFCGCILSMAFLIPYDNVPASDRSIDAAFIPHLPMSTRRMIRVFVVVLAAVQADSGIADETEKRTAQQSQTAPVQQIDQFIRQGWTDRAVEPAPRCSEREFVRRIYLDLVGRVPRVSEVDTYLLDQRKDKREALIDRLVTSEDYVQHFADLFDALLLGRTAEGRYRQRVEKGWRSYLEDVFRSNRSWDEVSREILLARPEGDDRRGAVWFLHERNNNHQAIAEAVAPAFFGIRIECAQCHDHMLADEIEQAHYWGLVAFFNRGKNVNTPHGPRVAESAIGGFSEFANLSGDSSPNLLTFLNAPTIDESRPEKDEKQEDADQLYDPPGLEGLPRIPKFSRRQQFVDEVLTGHPLLARAMVNKLCAIMLGRGLVHPYDRMDSVHQPSHPKLLDWLASDFEQSGYNVRRLIRSLALSEAYQLASVRPLGAEDRAAFAWYLERALTAEQLARSIQLVARGSFRNEDPLVGQIRQQIEDVLPEETVVGIAAALFFSNSPNLDDYLAHSNGDDHLIGRLSKLESRDEQLSALFQKALTRDPTSDEVDAVSAFLEQRRDSPEDALRQVLWSLITSAEFQFNH